MLHRRTRSQLIIFPRQHRILFGQRINCFSQFLNGVRSLLHRINFINRHHFNCLFHCHLCHLQFANLLLKITRNFRMIRFCFQQFTQQIIMQCGYGTTSNTFLLLCLLLNLSIIVWYSLITESCSVD